MKILIISKAQNFLNIIASIFQEFKLFVVRLFTQKATDVENNQSKAYLFEKEILGFSKREGFEDGINSSSNEGQVDESTISNLKMKCESKLMELIVPIKEELIDLNAHLKNIIQKLNIPNADKEDMLHKLEAKDIQQKKNSQDLQDTEPLKAQINNKESERRKVLSSKEDLYNRIGRYIPSNKILQKFIAILGSLLSFIIGVAEYITTVDVFRVLGLGETSVLFLTIVVSVILAMTSILAGEFKFDGKRDKYFLSLFIGIGTISLIFSLRIIFNIEYYMSLFPLIFWGVGYMLSWITTPTQRIFKLDDKDAKLFGEIEILKSSLRTAQKENRKKLDLHQASQVQNIARKVALANEILNFEKIDVEKKIEKLQFQQDSLKTLFDNIKKQCDKVYRKHYKKGCAERLSQSMGQYSIILILITCVTMMISGCSAIDHLVTPKHIAVEIHLDQTQKLQNRNIIDPRAISDFVFDEFIYKQNESTLRNGFTIALIPISDIYLNEPIVIHLATAGLDFKLNDRKQKIAEIRQNLITQLETLAFQNVELPNTKVHQALKASIDRLYSIKADNRYVILLSDCIQHDELVSLYNIDKNSLRLQQDSLIAILESEYPISNDLEDLNVYFIYTPNAINQNRVRSSQQFFKSMLESKKATVKIRANITQSRHKETVN